MEYSEYTKKFYVRESELAQYIINRAVRRKRYITPLQVQNIMWYITEDIIRNDRNIEAYYFDWKTRSIGPYLERTYWHLCASGVMEIFFETDFITEDKMIDAFGDWLNPLIDVLLEREPWALSRAFNDGCLAWMDANEILENKRVQYKKKHSSGFFCDPWSGDPDGIPKEVFIPYESIKKYALMKESEYESQLKARREKKT